MIETQAAATRELTGLSKKSKSRFPVSIRIVWVMPMTVSILTVLFNTPPISAEPKLTGQKRGLVHSLAFSPDGSYLAAGGESISVYEVKSGKLVGQWSPPPMTRAIAFLPGPKSTLAATGDGNVIRFYDVDEDRPVLEVKLHEGRVQNLAISPDGKLAASTAAVINNARPQRSELRVWNIQSGEIVGSIDLKMGVFFRPVFSSDGKSLLFPQLKRLTREDEESAASVEIYRVSDWNHLRSILVAGFVLSADFCQNGQELILSGYNNDVRGYRGPGTIWLANLRDNSVREIFTDPAGLINHVHWLGNENRFLFGTSAELDVYNNFKARRPQQAQVVMRSDLTGRDLWTSTSEDDRSEVQAIAVSPRGELVAWCTYATILIVDAERGRLVRGIGAAE